MATQSDLNNNQKKVYTKPFVTYLGDTTKIQAFAYGRVTESASSGYYDRT